MRLSIHRFSIPVLLAAGAVCLEPPARAAPPQNWDGLTRVAAKKLDLVYIRPGADFRPYTAVMLDQPEVAFRKNWQKEMNRSMRGMNNVSDADVRKAIDAASEVSKKIFIKRFSEAGFGIAASPADNVLRISVGIANVNVVAPERNMASRGNTFADRAGDAVLIIEARDSLSGELLGRAIDQGVAGDSLMSIRNSVTNWGDFEQLFDNWARISATGLKRLTSPDPTAR